MKDRRQTKKCHLGRLVTTVLAEFDGSWVTNTLATGFLVLPCMRCHRASAREPQLY